MKLEITTKAIVKYEKIVCNTCRSIGFVSGDVSLDADKCKVLVYLEKQSPDIAQLLPLSHVLATKLGARLTEVRKNETCPWVRNGPSSQHDETVTNDGIATDQKEHVIKPVIPEKYLDEETIFHLDPSGRFVIGGPHGDAAYIARQATKSILANGLARRCLVQISYAIGVLEPLSVFVDAFGTGKIPDKDVLKLVKEYFDLRPGMISIHLNLKTGANGRFLKTAAYGHFKQDDPDFTWKVVRPLK
ncbi:hypothetical protein VNO78_20544 [Psophocarpus tetragonolobus]|uniref:S-adenosylmethionine synthetase C-terminal domain-containing protein n=1 Tax=Psophocarpus tetragonolobus TaxID=3891 RepID=A0AAN9SA12_PSOTE